MLEEVPRVSISVVSHNNGEMIRNLLQDMRRTLNCTYEILLTINVPEELTFLDEFADLNLVVIRNGAPKGFGSNHNAAFHASSGRFFIIVNPDIRLPAFDFAGFVGKVAHSGAAALSAAIRTPAGALEDSARRDPTFVTLFLRFFTNWRRDQYDFAQPLTRVDWLAGMFVCFERSAFSQVGGFDEGFFMYLEDADIGRKLARAGFGSYVCTDQFVVHDAQRASKRSLTHLKWHLSSAFRYFGKYGYF